MTHTRGPWELDGDLGVMDLDIVGISGRIAMIDCENEDLTDEEVIANARIMRAAPDLLEALEDAVEALTEARYYPSELQRFRAAIAKAKGAVA